MPPAVSSNISTDRVLKQAITCEWAARDCLRLGRSAVPRGHVTAEPFNVRSPFFAPIGPDNGQLTSTPLLAGARRINCTASDARPGSYHDIDGHLTYTGCDRRTDLETFSSARAVKTGY